MKELLLQLLTPTNVAVAVSALLGLAATLFSISKMSEVRRRNIALATFHGYQIAKDIADSTPGPDGWDIAAAALKAADDYMKANGWRPLKEGEKALVNLTVQSLKAQEKVALAAVPQTPPSELK